jgi:probable HAF family extracellular repeat protein
VGWGNNAADGPRALLWTGTSVLDLGTLPGGAFSDARAINNRGDIVGSSGTATGSVHAVLWQNATIEDLGTAVGDSESYANAIADSGWIAGMGAPATFVFHPLEWRSRTAPLELGSFASVDTSALGVNERGWAVGYAGFPGATEALLWQDGAAADLGPGLAFAINSSGEVVGQSNLHAVVWHAGLSGAKR